MKSRDVLPSGEQIGKSIHEILTDPLLPFARKLQIATASELIYWEERLEPPNLSIQEFKRVLPLIQSSATPLWEPRKSTQGRYGKTGEKKVFKFDFQITLFGKRHQFFIKGYFFEEGNLRGVEIQSFRKKSNPKLRTV
jgi:hypothetical protein